MSMHFPPATPLAIILFIALAFLVISTISTPVIQQIPLAVVDNVHFGVLGYCTDGGICSKYQIGYDSNQYFNSETKSAQFSLPLNVRHSLSPLLIVHPIAAFLTLIDFLLAVAAHFHSPSHSPRYLLAMVILMFPTLLVTLLAFLVDILVFVPNMRWGSWIVLASTILLCISQVVTCSMRRMLVSRRATQKRLDQHLVEGNQTVAAANAVRAAQSEPEDGFKGVAVTATGVEDGQSFGIRRGDSVTSDQRELLPPPTNFSVNGPHDKQMADTYGGYDLSNPNNTGVIHEQRPYPLEGMGYALQPPEPWDNRQQEAYPMETFSPDGVPGYGPTNYYPSPRAMSPVYNQGTPSPRGGSPMHHNSRPGYMPPTGGRGMPLPPGMAGSGGGKRSPSRNAGNTDNYSRNSPGPGMMRQPTLPTVDPSSSSPSRTHHPRRTNSGTINFSHPNSPPRAAQHGPRNHRFSTSPTPPSAQNQQQQAAQMGPTPMINVDSPTTSGHDHGDSFHAINDSGYRGYYEDVEPRFAHGGEMDMELPRNLQPGGPSGEFNDYVADNPENCDTLDALHTPDDSGDDNAPDDADGVLPLLEHYENDNDGSECDQAHDHDHAEDPAHENLESQANASVAGVSRSGSNAQETGIMTIQRPAQCESRNITDSTDTSGTTSGVGLIPPPAATRNASMNMGMVTPSFSTPEFPPYARQAGPAPVPPAHRQSTAGLMHVRPVRSFAHPRFYGPALNEGEGRHQRWISPYPETSQLPAYGNLPQSVSYGSMPYRFTAGYSGPEPGPGYTPMAHPLDPQAQIHPQAQEFPPLSPPPLPSPGFGYDFPPHSPSFDHLDRTRTFYSHSPSPSLSSHFTSISQREINPRWRPEYDNQPPYAHTTPYNINNNPNRPPANPRTGAMSPRDQLRWRLEQTQQAQQGSQARGKRDRLDVLLEGNPDFELVVGKEARQREAERGGLLSQRVPADKGVLCGMMGRQG